MNLSIDLKNAICNNKLIVFVGAGLSFNLINAHGKRLKGWKNLVEHILIHLNQSGYPKAEKLLQLIDDYDPITILNLIESNKDYPKAEIYNFLKEFLDIENDQNDFTIHKKIASLSNKIISTNYDTSFETSLSVSRKNVAYKGKNYELTKHKDAHSKLLFKLHGCYEDSDSMVLFPSNYEDLYNNPDKDAEHSLLVLRNIVMNNSLLFIGTGMGDFQINSIFKEIKHLQGEYNQKHFIITNGTLDSSLDFLTPIPIKNFDEIDTIVDALIEHKSKCKGEEESEKIKKLQEELQKAQDELNRFRNKSNPNRDDLLEEEALKYFSRGLEHSINQEFELCFPEYERCTQLNPAFHQAYYNWGTGLGDLARSKKGEEAEKLFLEASEKFESAIQINPDNKEAFNNWGADLAHLARSKKGKEAEVLFMESFKKFERAIKINAEYDLPYNNWGMHLGDLARIKQGEEALGMYHEAFKKFEKAIELNPENYSAHHNYGFYLGDLARKAGKDEADLLFSKIFQYFDKATQINPEYDTAFYNWGTDLAILAQSKEIEEAKKLYQEALLKFERSTQINPNYAEAYYNWGTNLGHLARISQPEEADGLLMASFEKFDQALKIDPNIEQAYHNWALYLGDLAILRNNEETEMLYKEAFHKYELAIQVNPKYEPALTNLGIDLGTMALKKESSEAEELFLAAFEKFDQAIQIDPNNRTAYRNWGYYLGSYAQTKDKRKADEIFRLGIEKLKMSVKLGDGVYNLSCFYALKGDKAKALKHLKQSIENKEVDVNYILQDKDWERYFEDDDFVQLIEQFKE